MAKATVVEKIIIPAVAEVKEESVILELTTTEAADLKFLVGRSHSKVGDSLDKIYMALLYKGKEV